MPYIKNDEWVQLNNELMKLRSQATTDTEVIRMLRENETDRKEQLVEKKELIKELEQEVEDLEYKVESLEEELEDVKRMNDELEERNDKLDKELDKADEYTKEDLDKACAEVWRECQKEQDEQKATYEAKIRMLEATLGEVITIFKNKDK